MRAMIRPTELFIGLRYLRARRKTRFVSFITGISLAGIALGVAALIVILSVMNGFEGELRDRLLSMTAHGYVAGPERELDDWQETRERLMSAEGIVASAPFVEMEGMVRSGSDLRPIFVTGIDPQYERDVSGRTINFIAGDIDVLDAGGRGIVLGRLLALDLGVRVGDPVTLLVPKTNERGDLEPLFERFVVRGVFEAGVQDHDASLALVHLADAAHIQDLGDAVTGVRFLADDVMAAPEVSQRLQAVFGDGFELSDWTIENASYFRAIRLEKMMMSLILSLIIGVAAFNIVASLVMVVTDKTNEIAILRTLGMGPNAVVRVFFVQGAVIGWAGVGLGVIAGVLLAINVPDIVPVLERWLGFQVMPGDVYYVTRIPSVLEAADVILIGIAAFVLTSLATLYPARRAAMVEPAAALRYE